jgi:hypothetical protein
LELLACVEEGKLFWFLACRGGEAATAERVENPSAFCADFRGNWECDIWVMAAVACVRGGCVCSWINGVEKSREQFTVLERVRFCSSYYCRVVDCCVSSSSSSSSSVSWPFFFPVITMCSTSSSREKSHDIQPLRKRNTRAANPSRQQQGVTTTGRISASDLHLVTALHEFIAAGDLPPQQVPSTRDLARSGRQDLANAVRRRGYKVVGQLLANPNFLKTSNSGSVQTQPSSGKTPDKKESKSLIAGYQFRHFCTSAKTSINLKPLLF